MAKKLEQGELFEFDQQPIIKGYPELRWTGKRPYRSTQYYPAQLKESFGEPKDGWMNKIFWGDNLQVMSHMLREYRGTVNLIYIDPPFDSKADYKKQIKLRGKKIEGDSLAFEEKQYGDIWTSDEYLQFMYERLVLLRELLSEDGAIYLHCDFHRSAQLKLICDEVFGPSNFRNEIVWCYKTSLRSSSRAFGRDHDSILFYAKSEGHVIHPDKSDFPVSESTIKRWAAYADENGFVSNKHFAGSGSTIINTEDESKGFYITHGIPRDWWEISANVAKGNTLEVEAGKYPTQKPEELLSRIIKASSEPGDIVFDCFMGSGTTQSVAMQLGRRFLGADINLGSMQTATKRLISVANRLTTTLDGAEKYLGFEVYNVNNYDFFRNPVEAKELLVQALDIQPFTTDNVFDGELDGRKVKILPTNRIATKADLEGLFANLPYSDYDDRKEESPNSPVDHITLVCMGHEPDLKAAIEQELDEYVIDIEIVDILRDKKELEFKREAEANIVIEKGKLVIKSFYPLNLLQKLSLQKEAVGEWRELVESIMIDWNYDGAVMEPAVIDIPDKNEMVAGSYDVPEDAGTIKVKITDVLSESLELEVRNNG